MAKQRFRVVLVIDTECEETLDEAGIKGWTAEQFENCDLGDVQVKLVTPIYRPGQKPDGEAEDVHTEHCCAFHGCKYGNSQKDCTVEEGKLTQSYPCETCTHVVQEWGEQGEWSDGYP